MKRIKMALTVFLLVAASNALAVGQPTLVDTVPDTVTNMSGPVANTSFATDSAAAARGNNGRYNTDRNEARNNPGRSANNNGQANAAHSGGGSVGGSVSGHNF